MTAVAVTRSAVFAAAALLSAGAAPAGAAREAAVHGKAGGSFEVTLTPQAQTADAPGGRMTLRKSFAGDLSGSASGEMLTAGSGQSSGAYVAIERVTGRLAGREGSFFLVHRGIMNRGRPELAISVVPGSGTGGLVGLSGTMAIRIEGGLHFYTFDYDLPARD